MQNYPILRLLEKHGDSLAIAVALLPPAAGIIAAAQGASAWWLAGGLVAGGFLYLAARSYIELVRLMIDMLLPK